MNAKLENYLNTIDKHLRPLPTSERVDIVKEIKGAILEMEQEELSTEQILKRLGNPKELAKAYLGDLLSKETRFSLNHILTVCAFYGLTGLSGMFIIPILGTLAPFLIFFGILAPILGLLKLTGFLLGYDMSFIVFQIGSASLHPVLAFPCSVVMGALLIFLGEGAWKLLLRYIKTVSRTKERIST